MSTFGGAGSATVRQQIVFLQLSTREAQQTAAVPRRVLDPLRKTPLYSSKDARPIPMHQILRKAAEHFQQQQQEEESKKSESDAIALLTGSGENEKKNALQNNNNNNNNDSTKEPLYLLRTPSPGTPEYEREFDINNFPMLPLFAVAETRTVVEQIRQALSYHFLRDGSDAFQSDKRLVPLKRYYSYFNYETQEKQVDDQLSRERKTEVMMMKMNENNTNNQEQNQETPQQKKKKSSTKKSNKKGIYRGKDTHPNANLHSSSNDTNNAASNAVNQLVSALPNYINIYKRIHREDWMPFVEPVPARYSMGQTSHDAIRLPFFNFGQTQQQQNENNSSSASSSIPHYLTDPFYNLPRAELGVSTEKARAEQSILREKPGRESKPNTLKTHKRFFRVEKPSKKVLAYSLTPVRIARSSDFAKEKEGEDIYVNPHNYNPSFIADPNSPEQRQTHRENFDFTTFMKRCPPHERPWVTMFGLSVPFSTVFTKYYKQYDAYQKMYGDVFGPAAAQYFVLPVRENNNSDDASSRTRRNYLNHATIQDKIALFKSVRIFNDSQNKNAKEARKKLLKLHHHKMMASSSAGGPRNNQKKVLKMVSTKSGHRIIATTTASASKKNNKSNKKNNKKNKSMKKDNNKKKTSSPQVVVPSQELFAAKSEEHENKDVVLKTETIFENKELAEQAEKEATQMNPQQHKNRLKNARKRMRKLQNKMEKSNISNNKNKKKNAKISEEEREKAKRKSFVLTHRISSDSLLGRLMVHCNPQKYNPNNNNKKSSDIDQQDKLDEKEIEQLSSFESISSNKKSSSSSPKTRKYYQRLEFEELPSFWWWYIWEHRNLTAILPLVDPELRPVGARGYRRPFLAEDMHRTYMELLHEQELTDQEVQHQEEEVFEENNNKNNKKNNKNNEKEESDLSSSSYCIPREVLGNPNDMTDRWKKFLLRQRPGGSSDQLESSAGRFSEFVLKSVESTDRRGKKSSDLTGVDVVINALEIQLLSCNIDQISRLVASYRQFEDELYVKHVSFQNHVTEKISKIRQQMQKVKEEQQQQQNGSSSLAISSSSGSAFPSPNQLIKQSSFELMNLLPSTPAVEFRTTFLNEIRRWRYWRLIYSFYPTFAVKVAVLAASSSFPMKLPRLPMMMTVFERNDIEGIEYLKNEHVSYDLHLQKLLAQGKEASKKLLSGLSDKYKKNGGAGGGGSQDDETSNNNKKKSNKKFLTPSDQSAIALYREADKEIVPTLSKHNPLRSNLLIDFSPEEDPRNHIKKLLLQNVIDYKLPVVYYQIDHVDHYHHGGGNLSHSQAFDGDDHAQHSHQYHQQQQNNERTTQVSMSLHHEEEGAVEHEGALLENSSSSNNNNNESKKRGRKPKKPRTREVLINRTATRVFRSAISAIDAISFYQFLSLSRAARREIWLKLPKNQRLVLDNTNFALGSGEKPEDPIFDFMRYRLQLDAEEYNMTGGGMAAQLKKEAELRRQLSEEIKSEDKLAEMERLEGGEKNKKKALSPTSEKQEQQNNNNDDDDNKIKPDSFATSSDKAKNADASGGSNNGQQQQPRSRDTTLLVKALREEWKNLHPMDQAAFYNMEYIQNIFPEFKGFSTKDVPKYQRDWAYGDEAHEIAAEERKAKVRNGQGEKWMFGRAQSLDVEAQLGRQRLLRESEQDLEERRRRKRREEFERHQRNPLLFRGNAAYSNEEDGDLYYDDEDEDDEDQQGLMNDEEQMNEYTLSSSPVSPSTAIGSGRSLMKSLRKNDALHEVKGAPTFLM